MSTLSPKKAADIAAHVYEVRANSNLKDIAKMANSGIKDSFVLEQADHIEGASGALLVRKQSGFAYAAHGKGSHQGEALMAFRGTVTSRDWVSNLNIGLQSGPNGWPVHAGFHRIHKSMATELEKFMRGSKNPSCVHCVGHSLGGALATLAAAMLKESYGVNVNVYTFGAPRVGIQGFAQDFTRSISADNIYRVVHSADPVPMIPLFPFAHAPIPGNECHINWAGGRVELAAHNMSHYISSVENAGWNALRHPLPGINWRARTKAWLETASSGGAIPFATVTLGMISQALWWVLGKAASITVGTVLTSSVTVLDQLSYLLHAGAVKSKEIAEYIETLMERILRWMGRAVPKTINATAAFIRWVLDLLAKTLVDMSYRAITVLGRIGR